jgi:hypothetical protein
MFVLVVALILCSSMLAYKIWRRRSVCRLREMNDRIRLRNSDGETFVDREFLINWDVMRCAECGGFHPEGDDQCHITLNRV